MTAPRKMGPTIMERIGLVLEVACECQKLWQAIEYSSVPSIGLLLQAASNAAEATARLEVLLKIATLECTVSDSNRRIGEVTKRRNDTQKEINALRDRL